MAGTLHASAQGYDYLTFRQADGTETSLGIDNLTITFASGNLVATNGTQEFTAPLAGMDKMYFAAEPTAIDQATVQDGAAAVRIVNGTLLVDGTPAQGVSVYSLDGRRQPATGLSRGVYVVRLQGKTLKVLAQ